MFAAFKLLAKLRFLRGTALDIFGYTEERRTERQLIQDYERIDRGAAGQAHARQPRAGGADRLDPRGDPRLRPRQGTASRGGEGEGGEAARGLARAGGGEGGGVARRGYARALVAVQCADPAGLRLLSAAPQRRAVPPSLAAIDSAATLLPKALQCVSCSA